MKRLLLTILLCGVLIFGVTGCSNPVDDAKKDLENAKQELEETQKKYGWVEEETVNTIVAKFNTEVMDRELNTPASDDYMTKEDNAYWFGLTEDISYYLQPIKYSGDKEKDILDMSALYFNKDNYNEELAKKYAKCLIKANNYNITDEEIDDLIKEAIEKSDSNKTANNGKGISVGFVKTDGNYIFQVIRLYKEN